MKAVPACLGLSKQTRVIVRPSVTLVQVNMTSQVGRLLDLWARPARLGLRTEQPRSRESLGISRCERRELATSARRWRRPELSDYLIQTGQVSHYAASTSCASVDCSAATISLAQVIARSAAACTIFMFPPDQCAT